MSLINNHKTSIPRVVLLVETASHYGRSIVRGIHRYMASHHHWSVFLEQITIHSDAPDWVSTWKGDGIISRSTTPALAQAFLTNKLPVVDLTDRVGSLPFPQLWADNGAIGMLAARHFQERGFFHYAACGYDDELWSSERTDAFRTSIEPPDATFSLYQSEWKNGHAPSWDDELTKLGQWLHTLPKPVCVFASNDNRGKQILDACGRYGIRVPEEVAVIGVDNDPLVCESTNPQLTSIVPNAEQLGFLAGQRLDEMMSGQRIPAQIERVAPMGIEVRQSTNCVAVADPDIARALSFIKQHACQGATVQDIIQHVPLSRGILERRFRKLLGCSPFSLIRNRQLEEVRRLLTNTNLSLDRIAARSGFKHTEHLCVVFKREFGETPGRFRTQIIPGDLS